MAYKRILLWLSLFFSTTLARPSKYEEFTRNNLCAPQMTPIYGSKWCKFKHHQAEIGGTCWFSCMKGYHLRGPRVTQCVVSSQSSRPRYNDTVGFCEPNAPVLKDGKNGPYLVHSYDPAAYVIHVDSGEEVTLKSYYYLAMYVQTPGLNGVKDTVSFLVQGEPGRYIKSNGTHVYTDNITVDGWEERDRATFWLRKDRFFEGYAAFESFNKYGYYMVHRSRKIFLATVEDSEDRVCASYIWSPDL